MSVFIRGLATCEKIVTIAKTSVRVPLLRDTRHGNQKGYVHFLRLNNVHWLTVNVLSMAGP